MMIKTLMRRHAIGTILALALSGSCAFCDDFSAQRAAVESLADLTTAPAFTNAEGFKSTAHLKAIYFDSLDWKGKPTKVFAWLGLPENRKGKVPGVVLVHGGGGTAFKLWVQKWNDKGYAAISIAVEGQTDQKQGKAWQKHPWAGPKRPGIYGDSEEPLKDQWMYHAVADTILANSLLRSLPEVDATKVGLMGISWGGVITSTVMGIDPRFAFAIPVYGCGNLAEAGNQYGRALGKNQLYQQVWDPLLRLKKAKMPTLWFSWPQDQHFPMDKLAASYGTMPGDIMVSLIPQMGHGHGPPWNKPDSYAFADSIIQDGKPWCRQVDSILENEVYSVTFTSKKPLGDAVLISTTETGITGSRNWTESPAALKSTGDSWKASAKLPANTTAWFINVQADGLTASSKFQEKQPSGVNDSR
jgi:dienelactone hydrolase